ncbi:type II toxin-antitoxin system HipA family toxin [Microvirga lotononidis]|uniref:HipA domain-containing protein n=1 Tax=Microvirga lotononidis TaxID=864069 RepID=I4Z492_9HYPH|nr:MULTISPECIES: HipA domain-containing protein [Microvirga]EIM31034.1 HipA domain-containing protein [Microvirga lotononidis]WQO30988.1 HipA domain-containing protein [Microvirga lotononidis]
MPDVSILYVQLYGETIGTLTHVGGDRTIFAFSDSYIESNDRPTLSLSFKDEFGGLITDLPATQRRVAPFFANLLPEGTLRDYLAERAGVHVEREFFLLWVLGRDLPGALTIVPADGEAWPPEADSAPAKTVKRDRENALRFSLAGVQLKFSAVKNSGKNGGLVVPAQGVGGEWIVKLPSTRFEGVPENEYAMMSLARAVGIDVPEIQLLDVDSINGLPDGIGVLKGQAFAIKRFDRTADGPVHIEDFAQVFGVYPEDKYKKATLRRLAHVLGIESGSDSVAEFIRRVVFSVLIGNADMHLKNWSLIYPDRRTPLLAPAYDLVSTIPYLEDYSFALKFARTKRFDGFTREELSYLADKAGLPVRPALAVAQETVERFLTQWGGEKRHLPLPGPAVEAIDTHLARLPIVRTGF